MVTLPLTTDWAAAPEESLSGLFDELFPICRSVTGPGFRKSLDVFCRFMPLRRERTPSGTRVFDWITPPEWRIRAARLTGPSGETIADFARSNLSVVNYSEPVDRRLSLEELLPHLHSVPEAPDAIPYVTSYYHRAWGFCLPHRTLENLPRGEYHAWIDSEFVEGAVEVAECTLPGESEAEVVLTSYLCHPSMANNELSGPLALLCLYGRLQRWRRRRLTYRFILNPETIGSLCYLRRHGARLIERTAAGLVLTCLGGPHPRLSYQLSRRGDSLFDRMIQAQQGGAVEIREFDPADGSDERQYCSPGFNLPFGQIARTVYGRYPEYHTSLDDKEFMTIEAVRASVEEIERLLADFEIAGRFRNLSPFGEPQLGRHGIYPPINSRGAPRQEFVKRAMTLLNYADGERATLDAARRCGCRLAELAPVIEKLEQAGLLAGPFF